MSNNAPDYEDNLVFPPQDNQIVGEPEGKLKGKVEPLSEQEISNARVEAAKLIATAVGAATYKLKDQLQIKDMRIRKLKQQKQQREDLLQQVRVYVKINTEDYEDRTVSKAEKSEAKELLTKIDEVLR